MRSEWKNVSVAELGRIVTGKTPKTAIIDNYGGSIPFLTPSDDMEVKMVESTSKTLTEKGLREVRNYLLPPQTICVSCIGSDLGKVVMTTQPTVTNQQINSIIPNRNVDPNFIYYAMIILGRKLNYISKTSTAVPIINKSSFSNYMIKIPMLEEQRAIGDTLSALDARIANNRKINHHLEQMAQAIFKSWFVDFEPWGGKMPSDWTISTISDISANIICGKTPSTKNTEFFGGDIPFVTIPDMHGSVYVTSTERSLSVIGAESQSSKTVPPNSICVSCIATAGLVALTSVPSQTNQQINTIICKEGISPYFVYLAMVGMAEYIKMLGSSGSTTNNLNKEQFSKIEIVIPKDSDMKKFAILVEPLFQYVKANQQEISALTETRDTLLPRLMSGELSVADLGSK